jgi:uridine kinase
MKIFIETSEHHRIIRRLERDLKERGYNVEQTLYWLKNHVEPAYVKYVLPTKNLVDIIVPNYDNFDNAVKMIGGFLKSKI